MMFSAGKAFDVGIIEFPLRVDMDSDLILCGVPTWSVEAFA